MSQMTLSSDKHPSELSNQEFFGNEDPDIAYSRVWLYILKSQRKFYAQFAQALKKEGLGDPMWYEILFEIAQTGDKGKLMGEIEHKLMIPQYTISRQVGRMEQAGLIYREFIADGRRKQLLFLTELGAQRQEEVWPIYLETLKAEMGPLLNTDEAYDLARFLLRLLPNK
ncbi:MarR family winged helix-turn-helix transcriptional regulator [Shimia sp. MMG029]|uniref:MarR family winged helix-turn-helix transcriptional regulator n=1 Tax=Shimia sp. MMG029 TaxID=3021978 RepID=UPI0022FDF601|nr:MarR family winged helix-turn-helix transcriptional regulator [Shimia sp. MMG029]MDA5558779.1 MarR family winged helix-turn-helix transcriptional regulator [Shimia sp. MMG029]